ncbi:hypothetical protein [Paraburkholderia unamae]|uniref:Uncharacterized protein n=1 Tax=Paraburkholderia unamae TaxID=219649 RepID=A0ABX5KBW2_9BURK|nr:hypothetical protein [Paraburkholderia unamae]PVX71650.1 hypothetical protein C7402_12873 [Paraburkholderia unamae]RAR61085.1 hypothetical protein C7401_10821 [Paraburkholderia unamae]CAG9274751.1 conserved hypothetical protein [Paraburkholderia unamae]
MPKLSMPAWFTRRVQARHDRTHSPSGAQVASREPEHLERIASYARAGYFNMAYTPDMYPLIGDLPPH